MQNAETLLLYIVKIWMYMFDSRLEFLSFCYMIAPFFYTHPPCSPILFVLGTTSGKSA